MNDLLVEVTPLHARHVAQRKPHYRQKQEQVADCNSSEKTGRCEAKSTTQIQTIFSSGVQFT